MTMMITNIGKKRLLGKTVIFVVKLTINEMGYKHENNLNTASIFLNINTYINHKTPIPRYSQNTDIIRR